MSRISRLPHPFRALWIALVGLLLGLVAPPSRAEDVGLIYGVCQDGGAGSRVQLKYTRYRDAAVWQDPIGLGSMVTDMNQWGAPWWEGVVDTGFRRYFIKGQGEWIELWLEGGVYSDMLEMKIAFDNPQFFRIYDPYGTNGALICRRTG